MEYFSYQFPATKKLEKYIHVGVVGSGNLEVIFEPSDKLETNIHIRTGINGYRNKWDELIKRFFEENDIAANIKINDFGATPGVVKLRLLQAIEVSNDG